MSTLFADGGDPHQSPSVTSCLRPPREAVSVGSGAHRRRVNTPEQNLPPPPIILSRRFAKMGRMPIMTSPLTFQASDVLALTGLSPNQLREWTSRRGIVPADQPARGRGKHARYAWNTILVLRILAELKRMFGIEIGAWADLGTRLRDNLAGTSPIALYGRCLFVREGAFDITIGPLGPPDGATIVIPLDPHLEVLAVGLGVPSPPGQLSLFPVVRA